MKLGKNAYAVLEKRYLSRDEENRPTETVEGLFRRVALTVASADLNFDKFADIPKLAEEFYEMMTNLKFLPNSPTLMNAGKELGQLSACFVLPVEDSMDAIFEAIKQAALIHKSGGGTGFSFSRLRPAGSTVKSTGGVASGPISFMKVFNMATEAVKQGGTRRGANMGILRVDHPDILDFVDCKQKNTEITNFNISVGLTEKFMIAVEENGDYQIYSPKDNQPVGVLNAKMVFDKIVHNAWANGEPGIIFLDRLNRDNAVPSMGEIESTNPCGEQPLLPYESCNLGSVNLLEILEKTGYGEWEIDYERLKEVVHKAVHFLDNVIEVNKYPLEEIAETTKASRKIGLGVMGFADMLLRLGIPYNSEEGVALGGTIMEFVNREGHIASQNLAKLRGPFPKFSESIYKNGPPMRNATVTTIAPTGTLSIIAGCSSGVEPVFAYAYVRNVMDGAELLESNDFLLETLKENGHYNKHILRRIAAEGTLAHIEELPENLRRIFVCAHDITPVYHVRMQAAFQNHTDNAVSKTVNFPREATESDVEEVYRLAYKLGCKGTTIYRDGSRESQVLNIGSVNKNDDSAKPAGPVVPRPRPESVMGLTKRVAIGCGNLYVTVNYDDHGICEVFTSTGKAGGCPSQSEATARLISVALRSGIEVEDVLRQIRGIRCPSTIRQNGMKCASCPDAIARVIKEVNDNLSSGQMVLPAVVAGPVAEVGKKGLPLSNFKMIDHACPECGESLEHEGGCVSCRNCGYSKCS